MKKNKTQILILEDYKVPSWNQLYSGGHWSKRSEMAEFAHQTVYIELKKQKVIPYVDRVNILIEAHLKRTIDPDNVCSKIIIDGLKTAGVIKDDTSSYVDKVSTRVVKSKADFCVVTLSLAS